MLGLVNLILDEGVCPLCEESRIIFHLGTGVSACESCLDVLAKILEAASEPISIEELMRNLLEAED